MKKLTGGVLVVLAGFIAAGSLAGCSKEVQSVSGTEMQVVKKVPTDSEGLTIEQRNIRDRIAMDNQLGSIKHLYVISAYSGQVLIYSTVRGKVTSSGKRLTPSQLSTASKNEFRFDVGGYRFYTDEVLQEDGVFGPSIEYLYWWDTKGIYHQHYVSGGQIIHISDQPLAVKGIIINMEIAQKPQIEITEKAEEE